MGNRGSETSGNLSEATQLRRSTTGIRTEPSHHRSVSPAAQATVVGHHTDVGHLTSHRSGTSDRISQNPSPTEDQSFHPAILPRAGLEGCSGSLGQPPSLRLRDSWMPVNPQKRPGMCGGRARYGGIRPGRAGRAGPELHQPSLLLAG